MIYIVRYLNKLIIAIILGIAGIVIGGILLAYSSYYSQIAYNYNYPSCYQLYPYTYNNVTHAYNYSNAYYACERNYTMNSRNDQLYASVLSIPGWTLVFTGAVTVILSIALLLLAVYKDRNVRTARK